MAVVPLTSKGSVSQFCKHKAPPETRGAFDLNIAMKIAAFRVGRLGSDLLFQALRLSTIDAEDFDGRVRDVRQIGCLDVIRPGISCAPLGSGFFGLHSQKL